MYTVVFAVILDRECRPYAAAYFYVRCAVGKAHDTVALIIHESQAYLS